MAELSNREKDRQMAAQQNKKSQKIATIIIVIIAAVLLVGTAILLSVINNDDSIIVTDDQTTEQQVETLDFTTPSGALQIPTDNLREDAVRVDYFFDPHCPACQMFSVQGGGTLMHLSDTGEIDLYVHPVTFLGQRSDNDYSGLAANAVVTVYEHAPEQTLEFMKAIYDPEFFPMDGTRDTEELIDVAVTVGVAEEDAQKIADLSHYDWAKMNTTRQQERDDFFPAGDFGTPAVFVSNATEDGEGQLDGEISRVDFGNGQDIERSLQDAINSMRE